MTAARAQLFRRKSYDALEEATDQNHRLRRSLSWPHLLALGVGAIVGTGIYTLIGVGAALAGPGVLLSFVVAGMICACAALAYAEMASMIPASGSAYTYTYTVLGELLAWIVGWSLILEYTVVCSAVAVGWSGHVAEFLPFAPHALLAGPSLGGVVNLPAVGIALVVASLLVIGTRESATVNLVLVAIKVLALTAFVVIAARSFNLSNFHPFLPFGFSSHGPDGGKTGVIAAASIIFFAFYGFDAISTAAEETKEPARDLTIGILGSMAVCVVIYIAVAGAAIGAMPAATFARSPAPLVLVLNTLRQPLAAKVVAAAAVVALPTVILAFMYGQSRIFFVMSRDGLLPRALAVLNPRTGSPALVTAITGVLAAGLAGFFPLDQIAALANAGTLCAFVAVGVCLVVSRLREPQRTRPFKAPLWWLIGPLGVIGCFYLFINLPTVTIALFFVWNALGLGVYFGFARRGSLLANRGF